MKPRNSASPIELSALLMDAVCGQDERERESLQKLAAYLEIPLPRIQEEMLFIRAFAVEFAVVTALGDGPSKSQLVSYYYSHWDQVAGDEGLQLKHDLQQRLELYSEAINQADQDPDGLRQPVGQAFALLLEKEEAASDLIHLGGNMFAALAAEVMDMLSDLDIVLLEPENEKSELN